MPHDLTYFVHPLTGLVYLCTPSFLTQDDFHKFALMPENCVGEYMVWERGVLVFPKGSLGSGYFGRVWDAQRELLNGPSTVRVVATNNHYKNRKEIAIFNMAQINVTEDEPELKLMYHLDSDLMLFSGDRVELLFERKEGAMPNHWEFTFPVWRGFHVPEVHPWSRKEE